MRAVLRTFGSLALALCCFASIGCLAGVQNRSAFPYLLTGTTDVVKSHSKPGGHGYYKNYDPPAATIVLRPVRLLNQFESQTAQEVINPVRTQLLVVATVLDKEGVPLRERRIEWNVSGKGHILEVDESGWTPGRGWVEGNRATSFTARDSNRINRGNVDKNDDAMIRPGQSWIVVTSDDEGDTTVSAFAPEINDWNKRITRASVRWVDADYEFPAPGKQRADQPFPFVTKIIRNSDKQALSGYRVRYRIIDGPQAGFVESGTTEYEARSDLGGRATATIRQANPTKGVSNVEIEVVRPPDASSATGTGVVVGRGRSFVEWLSPAITLSHVGPGAAVVGEVITYTTTVQNTGDLDNQWIGLTVNIPPGLQYIGANFQPDPNLQNAGRLLFALPGRKPGEAHVVQTRFQAKAPGTVTSIAQLETSEKQKDQKETSTVITEGRLSVNVTGPNAAGVNQPIDLVISVTNPGSAPLQNVTLTAILPEGLVEPTNPKDTRLEVKVTGGIGAGQTINQPLKLVALTPGLKTVAVIAIADGLSAQAKIDIMIGGGPLPGGSLGLNVEGTTRKYVGTDAEFKITVNNPTTVPITNLFVRATLPLELEYKEATAQPQVSGADLAWNFGTLAPGETKSLGLKLKAKSIAQNVQLRVTANAEGGLADQKVATLEIFGTPALKLELRDEKDPVRVGEKVEYVIAITNTGTLPAQQIEIVCELPIQASNGIEFFGPTKGEFVKAATATNGPVIVFRYDTLPPGTPLVYAIKATASLPKGDARMICRVRSATITEPIREDESTTIVEDAPPGPGVMLVPPPAPNPLGN